MSATDPTPPSLQQLQLRDGTTIAYRERGSGPAVLLLHGWPTSSFLWRQAMLPISAAQRVIAVDLPGFGGSDKPARARYDFDFFEGVLDELTEAWGLDRFGLAGHDIGGALAAHWAIARPERITRLALLNTVLYPDFSPEVVEFVTACTTPALRERLTSDEGLAEVLRQGVTDHTALPPEVLDAYRTPFDTARARRTLARAGVGLDPSGFEQIAAGLPELRMPVGVVYGDQDRVLGDVAGTFARLQRDLPAAEVTPVVGAGHFVPEEAPGPVGELLARFFGAAGSGGRQPHPAR